MSRRGNCWDNAPQESFFGHFKDEAYIKQCNTLEELQYEIKQYMIYYNRMSRLIISFFFLDFIEQFSFPN